MHLDKPQYIQIYRGLGFKCELIDRLSNSSASLILTQYNIKSEVLIAIIQWYFSVPLYLHSLHSQATATIASCSPSFPGPQVAYNDHCRQSRL